jgi:hypothetical protein
MSAFEHITPEEIIGDSPPAATGPERGEDEKKSNWHFHVQIRGEEPTCYSSFPADTEDEAIQAAISDVADDYYTEHPDADGDLGDYYCDADCEHEDGEHCEIRVFRMPDIPFHAIPEEERPGGTAGPERT